MMKALKSRLHVSGYCSFSCANSKTGLQLIGFAQTNCQPHLYKLTTPWSEYFLDKRLKFETIKYNFTINLFTSGILN